MNAYRDQYAQIFRNGRGVVLIALSNDADTTQASWAHDSEFPFVFASDTGLHVSQAYGAVSRYNSSNRNLFIIGPDGKIAWRATPFREVDPAAYTALKAAIDSITGPRDSTQH